MSGTACADAYEDERLRSEGCPCRDWLVGARDMAGAAIELYEAVDVKDAVDVYEDTDDDDEGIVDILRSLPRPLIPLLEFL